ncbi:MAG: HAD hydrolase-like protein [Acidobacteriaceae bacterium]|nr:HAD hydrolase-like protein [Acidobacteriaceae bacterium]
MGSQYRYQVLYSDIGGVLGTNGWDANLRHSACAHFGIAPDEIEGRHQLVFDSYERGYLSFEQYLRRVFFNKPRDFELDDVRDYTYEQSIPWPQNIALFRRVKEANDLKLGLISNEGAGIAQYRVGKFGLRHLAHFMVISHFVHLRKPDPAIWQLALDLAQVTPAESIYVDDRELFVNVAADLGFTAFQHVSLESTRERFLQLGLAVE